MYKSTSSPLKQLMKASQMPFHKLIHDLNTFSRLQRPIYVSNQSMNMHDLQQHDQVDEEEIERQPSKYNMTKHT